MLCDPGPSAGGDCASGAGAVLPGTKGFVIGNNPEQEGPMKKIVTASALAICLVMGFLSFLVAASRAQDDWQQQVAQALGKAGTAAGGVYRIGLPRTDIKA